MKRGNRLVLTVLAAGLVTVLSCVALWYLGGVRSARAKTAGWQVTRDIPDVLCTRQLEKGRETPPATRWVRDYQSASWLSGLNLLVAPDGTAYRVIIENVVDSATGSVYRPALVTAFTPRGKTLWSKKLAPAAPGYDEVCPALDLQGNLYLLVSIYTDEPGHCNLKLLKLSGTGQRLWSREYDGYWPSSEALAVSSAGDAYVAATTPSRDHLVLRRVDPNGNELWARPLALGFRKGYEPLARSMIVKGDGEIVIAGRHCQGIEDLKDTEYRPSFLGTVDSEGRRVRMELMPKSGYEILGLARDWQDNVYVCGLGYGGGSPSHSAGHGRSDHFLPHQHGFVVKYSSKGDRLWGRTVGCDGTSVVLSLATDSKGHVYATGYRRPFSGPASVKTTSFLRKLAPDGGLLWEKCLSNDSAFRPRRVATGPQGEVLVVGHQGSGTRDKAWLSKLGP